MASAPHLSPRPTEYGPKQTTDLTPEGEWTVIAKDFLDLAGQLGASGATSSPMTIERIPGFCALCRSRCGCDSVVEDGRLVPIYAQRIRGCGWGGLLSYGPSAADMSRRAAVYVDRILKGRCQARARAIVARKVSSATARSRNLAAAAMAASTASVPPCSRSGSGRSRDRRSRTRRTRRRAPPPRHRRSSDRRSDSRDPAGADRWPGAARTAHRRGGTGSRQPARAGPDRARCCPSTP